MANYSARQKWIYYHFTCSDRRQSISLRGLLGNSPAMIDADPENASFKNADIFFVRYPAGTSRRDVEDRDKALFVMCFVKGTCEDNGSSMDIWRYEDHDNLMIRHDLPGEYRMSRPSESRIVNNWSSQLACVRVPPTKLQLIQPEDLPEDLYESYLYSDECI